MIELVRETDIATIVSTHALRREDVKLIPLESPTPVRSPGLLWRRDEARTPAARSFASIVRSVSDSESRDTRRNTVRAARR